MFLVSLQISLLEDQLFLKLVQVVTIYIGRFTVLTCYFCDTHGQRLADFTRDLLFHIKVVPRSDHLQQVLVRNLIILVIIV